MLENSRLTQGQWELNLHPERRFFKHGNRKNDQNGVRSGGREGVAKSECFP